MEFFSLIWLPLQGREANENNIFVVAKSPTAWCSWLAEGTTGLRRLAAPRRFARTLQTHFHLTAFNSYGNIKVPLIAGWKSKPKFWLRLAVARLKKGQVPKNYVRSYRDGR